MMRAIQLAYIKRLWVNTRWSLAIQVFMHQSSRTCKTQSLSPLIALATRIRLLVLMSRKNSVTNWNITIPMFVSIMKVSPKRYPRSVTALLKAYLVLVYNEYKPCDLIIVLCICTIFIHISFILVEWVTSCVICISQQVEFMFTQMEHIFGIFMVALDLWIHHI